MLIWYTPFIRYIRVFQHFFHVSLVLWFPFRLISITIRVWSQLKLQFLRLFSFRWATLPHRCGRWEKLGTGSHQRLTVAKKGCFFYLQNQWIEIPSIQFRGSGWKGQFVHLHRLGLDAKKPSTYFTWRLLLDILTNLPFYLCTVLHAQCTLQSALALLIIGIQIRNMKMVFNI